MTRWGAPHLAFSSEVWKDEVWEDEVWKDEVWKTRCGKSRCGKTKCGKTRYGKTRYGKTRCGKTRYGKTRYGKTRCGRPATFLPSGPRRPRRGCGPSEMTSSFRGRPVRGPRTPTVDRACPQCTPQPSTTASCRPRPAPTFSSQVFSQKTLSTDAAIYQRPMDAKEDVAHGVSRG